MARKTQHFGGLWQRPYGSFADKGATGNAIEIPPIAITSSLAAAVPIVGNTVEVPAISIESAIVAAVVSGSTVVDCPVLLVESGIVAAVAVVGQHVAIPALSARSSLVAATVTVGTTMGIPVLATESQVRGLRAVVFKDFEHDEPAKQFAPRSRRRLFTGRKRSREFAARGDLISR